MEGELWVVLPRFLGPAQHGINQLTDHGAPVIKTDPTTTLEVISALPWLSLLLNLPKQLGLTFPILLIIINVLDCLKVLTGIPRASSP